MQVNRSATVHVAYALATAQSAWRFAGPTAKCLPKIRGIAESQCGCDLFDRQLAVSEVFDRKLRSEIVSDLAVRRTRLLKPATEGAGRYAELLADVGQAHIVPEICKQRLANLSCNSVAKFQLRKHRIADRENGLMSNGISERSRPFQKSTVEYHPVFRAAEADLAP